jgi:hypothetical protein
VRAENDRVIAAEALDESTRFVLLLHVQAGGRLVEDQHIRVVQQRLGKAYALPVPFRELRAMAVAHVGDLSLLHHRLKPRGALGPGHALDPRAKGKVVEHGHVRVERRRFRKVTRSSLGFDRLLENVVTSHESLALGRRHVTREHAHRGGFARAVRSQEPENLSPLSFEAHVVDCRHRTVPLREVLNFDHLSSLPAFFLNS